MTILYGTFSTLSKETCSSSLATISRHINNVITTTNDYADILQEQLVQRISQQVEEGKKHRTNVGECSNASKKIAAALKSMEKEEKSAKRRWVSWIETFDKPIR